MAGDKPRQSEKEKFAQITCR